jgi:hypothetical protein
MFKLVHLLLSISYRNQFLSVPKFLLSKGFYLSGLVEKHLLLLLEVQGPLVDRFLQLTVVYCGADSRRRGCAKR